YGFKAFGNLLEAAQEEGLLEVGRDDKSGTYVYRSSASDKSQAAVAGAQEKHGKQARKRGRSGAKPAEASSGSPSRQGDHPPVASDKAAEAARPTATKHAKAPSQEGVAEALPPSAPVATVTEPTTETA